ncbi:helix-turn-helix transcriptional regulator [Vibrio sp.]|uniref:helix-turn-helix transcriptional regulator n=1 Tax=Vibrio sp. TaxID=678 RepID=UPI003D0D9FC6
MDAKWIAQTAKLVAHANDESLFEHLTQFLVEEVNFQQLLVMVETKTGPIEVFDKIYGQYTHEQLTHDYLDGAYLLDPFYMFERDSTGTHGFYHLIDVTPEGFYLSDFYQSYYADSGLLDELQYWQQVSDDMRITINISRTKESRFFTPQEIELFKALDPIVQAVITSYWKANQMRLESKNSGGDTAIDMRQRLDSALAHFGRSLLTDRECDVVRTMLGGYTTKSAAQKLGISPETVHMHRKNIYTKLDISSQSEVFALFLDAVAESDGALNSDPLIAHNQLS